jgi:chemotaxis protein histidine kinase CheA
MKRRWLASAALIAILPGTALAQALPQPARGAAQGQQQRQQQPAPAPGQANDLIAEDLSAGRITPAQADQLRRSAEAAQQRINAADHYGAVKREIERDGAGGLIDRANRTFDAAQGLDPEALKSGDFSADGTFARDGSEFYVGAYETGVELERAILLSQAGAAAEKQLLQESGNFMRERAEMIRNNPNASQNDRLQADFEARTIDRYARTVEQRRAEDLRKLDRAAQKLRDAKEKVEREINRMAKEYGPNPKDWPQQAGQAPQPQRTAGAAPPPPPSPPAPVTPPPPDPLTAPPPPAQTQARPVKKGVVPGANGDPFAGLRVSQSQGGSAQQPSQADTSAQTRAAQAAREQQQRDEAMAQRIADSRQAAMDAARDTRDQLDQAWNRPTQYDLEQEALQRQATEMLEALNRKGNLGGGGGGARGGGGFGGLDSQLAGGSGFVEDWGRLRPDWPDGPADAPFDAGAAFDEMLAEYRAIEAETAAMIGSWRSFELGGTLTVAELMPIYRGWDPMTAPIGSSGRSLSAAGTSLSAAGNSLSSAGNSLSSMGTSLSSAGSPLPDLWSYRPSAAPQGYAPNWGAGFSPSDPFRVRPMTGSGQFRLPPGGDPGPSLCGR